MDPGTKLGPYEILEQLGAGGMGEVYLAEDTRLHRNVAVKVLPDEFAGDPDRLARFEQEARAAAALNHPHIAAVHDIGVEGDTHYMVQEYLKGHTLRDALEQRELPLARALELATEVGEALVVAHGAGIVHRDLKPDNIFVTEQGHAKVLDFGLAKLAQISPVSGSASMSPTMLGTVAGEIMGTVGYMAPEQVRGEPVDHRADIFAFGCVLYGMVAGNQPFSGRNVMQTLDRILEEDPAPLIEINTELPGELRRIVRKTLAKQPGMRYQTAADLVVDLRMLAADPIPVSSGGSSEAVVGPGAGTSVQRLILSVAATAIIAAAATWFLKPESAPAVKREVRFDVVLDEYTTRVNNADRSLAISSSGTHIAYVLNEAINVRALAETDSWMLAGTEGATAPVFSPDGESIAYVGRSRLWIVPVAGGSPTPLDARTSQTGLHSWSADGRLLYIDQDGAIAAIRPGGSPEVLVDDEQGVVFAFPSVLPDGSLLFTVWEEGGSRTEILSPSGSRRVLSTQEESPRYVSTGHLLTTTAGRLIARPFVAGSGDLPGPATTVLEGLSTNPSSGVAEYFVSDAGDLVYWPAIGATAGLDLTFYWVDLEGNETLASSHSGHFRLPRLSPDGGQIATMARNEDGPDDIWLLDLPRDIQSRFTNGGDNHAPTWTPDGTALVFGSNLGFVEGARVSGGDLNLHRQALDQSTDREVLLEAPDWEWVSSVTPDGEAVVYSDRTPDGEWSIWMLSIADGEARPLIQEPGFVAKDADVSPDGEWFAYWSDRSGKPEVYLERFPEGGGRVQLSSDGGRHPRWAPDGTRIYYTETTRRMMVVDVVLGDSAVPSRPQFLFEGRYATEAERNYDVHPDGDQLLMLRSADPDADQLRLHVVLNWFDILNDLAPIGLE